MYILKNGTQIEEYFEIGYIFFCSVLKSLGASYWVMTFVVNSIYFIAIYKLFNHLKKYRIFALFILVLLDNNLMFFQYRQQLAVAFFVFSFLALIDKKYVRYILYALLSLLMHKSAIFICILTFIAFNIEYVKITKKEYFLLVVLLSMLMIIPIKPIILYLLSFSSLETVAIESLKYHLALGKNIQVIFIVYFFAILGVFYYNDFRSEEKKWHWFLFLTFLIVVLFYQYWFFLNRIRSYFLPFILVYVINMIVTSKSGRPLVKQLLIFSIFAYSIHYMYTYYEGQNSLVSKAGESCTLFDLKNKTEEQIKQEQLQKASVYWEKDYYVGKEFQSKKL